MGRPEQSSVTTTSNIWEVYDFVKPLGSGTFGVVREVRAKRSRKHYAVKTVPKAADVENPGCGQKSLLSA